MNIYKLEERILFEAAAAVTAADAAGHSDSNGTEDKNQPESGNENTEKSAASASPVPEHGGTSLPFPMDASVPVQSAESGAASQITEAIRNLPGTVSGAEENPSGGLSHNFETFLRTDQSGQNDARVLFQDLFAEKSAHELVVLNSSVQDADSIRMNLNADTDVLRIESGDNALNKINAYLDSKGDVRYDAIHLVTHGNSGFFVLNGKSIDSETIDADREAWAGIGSHLSPSGDLLIYGCNLAESSSGRKLLNELSGITGADVAASTDRTGLGGNSILEYQTGRIEAFGLNFESYRHSLTAYPVTTDADSGLGSLRQAVLDANADPGGGEIVFSSDYQILLQSELLVTDSLTVSGTGIGRTVISVAQSGISSWRAFHITSGDVAFTDLTISGGNIDSGAGIYLDGPGTSVSLDRVLVEDGSASADGGGLAVNGGRADVLNSLFYGNSGGGISVRGGGVLNLLNSTLVANGAYGVGILDGSGNLSNDISVGNTVDLSVSEASGILRSSYVFYGTSAGTVSDLGGSVSGCSTSDLYGISLPVPDVSGRLVPHAESIAIGNGTAIGSDSLKYVFFDFSSESWKYIDGSDSSGISPASLLRDTGDQTAVAGMRGSYYVTAGSIDFNLSDHASYRSFGSGGDWSSAASWQGRFSYSGSTGAWVNMRNHFPDSGNADAILISDGSTVTLTRSVHASGVTVGSSGILTIAGGGVLNLDSGTSSGTDLLNAGTLSIAGILNSASGAVWTNAPGSSVLFNGTDQTVNGGTYYNLSLIANNTLGGNVIVDGVFQNAGILDGAYDLLLNGAVSGSGTVNMSGGTATYAGSGTIFGGIYHHLSIASGAIGFGNDAFVTGTFNAGNQNIVLNDHILTLNGDVLNWILLTPGLGTVVYRGDVQTIAGVPYHHLTLAGSANILNGTASVSGVFSNNAVLSGTGSLGIAGTVSGAGTMNMSGGTVTYSGTMTLFAGTYYNLTLSGASGTSFTAGGALSVSNVLALDGGNTLILTAADAGGVASYTWDGNLSVLSGTVSYTAANPQTVVVDSYAGGLLLSNGTKYFLPGTYELSSEILLSQDSSLSLLGSGVGSTVLSVLNPGVQNTRVLHVDGGVLFVHDMRIVGGDVSSAGNGGAILVDRGILSLERVTVSSGRAILGGGIYLGSGTLYMDDATLIGNNSTSSGGGIYLNDGSVNMVDCTIAGNQAGLSGGGLFSAGVSCNIVNSIILGNTVSSSANDFVRSSGTVSALYTVFGTVSGGFIPVADTNLTGESISSIFGGAPVLNADGTVSLSPHSPAIGNGTPVGAYAQKYVYFDFGTGAWKYIDGSDSSAIVQNQVLALPGDALGTTGRRGNYYVTIGALDSGIQSASYQSAAGGDWDNASTWFGTFVSMDGAVYDTVPMWNHTPTSSNSTSILVSHAVDVHQDVSVSFVEIATGGLLSVKAGVVFTLDNPSGTALLNQGTLELFAPLVFTPGSTWMNQPLSTVIYAGADQTVISGSYANLTFAGSGEKSLSGNVSVANTFDAGNRNVVLGSNTLTLSGDVVHFSALSAGSGTVVYDGASQDIAPLVYNNLTLLGGVNYFAAGTQSTVNGVFSLHGTSASDLAYINSSSPGTQWLLVLGTAAVADVEYVKITDSNSNRMISLNSNNMSGGNNSNWQIVVDLSGITAGSLTFGSKLGSTVLFGNAQILGSQSVAGTLSITAPNTLPQVSDSGLTAYAYTFRGTDSTYLGGSSFTLTVLARPVTVSVNSGQGKIYGNTDPVLRYTVTSGSLLSGDSFSGALTRDPGESPGIYSIMAGTLGLNGNYALTVIPGVFTILTRNVTVTIANAGKIYGDADPSLSWSITSGSLASGDSFSGFVQRTAGENVGSYTILQNTLALNANYHLTVIPGTFTISQRPLEITGIGGTKIYGESDPSFSYAVTAGSLMPGDVVSGDVVRVAGENVGSYALRIGTLSVSSNYLLTYKPGTFTVTPRALEITADNLSRIYGYQDPFLTWRITSGTLIGTDSFTGTLIRDAGTHVGTYAIRSGTLSAGSNYTMTVIPGAFTITPRSIVLSPEDASKVYGDADTALPFTVIQGKIVPGDVFSGSLSRASGENVGTYAVAAGTLTLGGDYNLSIVGSATLSITPRTLVLAAENSGKTYGDADPVLGYTIVSGSLVSGDSLSGAIARASGENAGTYAIRSGSLSAGGNYNLQFQNATFTVTPRNIAVEAIDRTKIYGDADPVLGYTIVSGSLVSGDSFEGGLLRDAENNVGSYAINQGTLRLNANYNLTFDPGVLTVTPRPITIYANTVYTTPSDPLPALTWHVSNLIPGDPYTGELSFDPITGVISLNTLSYGANYTQTFVAGSVILSPDPVLSIVIDDAQKIYGDADPVFNFQTPSLPVNLTVTGTLARANGENAGEYAIYLNTLQIIDGTLDVTGQYRINTTGGTLTITSRPLIVTPDAGQGKIYDGSSHADLTFQYAGVVGSDSVGFNGELGQSGINAGTYAIVRNTLYTTNSNYTVQVVSGVDYTIFPRPITVSGVSSGKVYGNADPSLTYEVTSGTLVSGDSISGSVVRDPGSDVGTYAIRNDGMTAGSNYSLTYQNGSFRISPRPLTVTITPGQSREYDGTDQAAILYTYANAVSGDPNPFSGALIQKGIDVGSYKISLGTLHIVNPNYTFTMASGTVLFQIVPAEITITADAKIKTYGYEDPDLTYRITDGTLASGESLSGQLSRDAGENIGIYSLTLGSLSAGDNYHLNFIGSTLTVNVRPIVVRAEGGEKVYGDADPTLSYSIASGFLAFGDSFTGSLIRAPGENVGSYAIARNTLSLNGNYAMSFVSEQFVITPRPITVTADDQTIVYGSAAPVFTYQTVNLIAGDILNGSLVCPDSTHAGVYSILQGSLSHSNYSITYVPGLYTVEARPITVTANGGQSKIYGNSDPSLTYAVTSGSLVSGDSLHGSLSRASGENVGAYLISRGSLNNSDYAITYQSASFSITPRPLTVTPEAGQGKMYGNSDPSSIEWTIVAGDLAGGDTLSGAPVRASGENVGSYAITQGSLGGSNYTITFLPGSFTITSRPITIGAVTGQSKTYGDADPVFEWRILSGTLVAGDIFSGSLSRRSGESIGSYGISVGTFANPNYSISFFGASFNINPRPVTIGATVGQTKIYGNADPTLTWEVLSGTLVSGDVLTGSLIRVSGSGVGTYAINRGTLNNTNYAISYVSQNFNITPRPLTVTPVAGQGKIYGASDSTLLWRVSAGNLVGSDSLNGSLSRVSGEHAGTYNILQNTLANRNYMISYEGGVYTISPRPISVGAKAGQSKIYGNADPVYQWQILSGSFVGSDTLSGSMTRASGSDVGTYAFGAGTLNNPDYLMTFVSGNPFTITPRALVVTADSGQGKIYGNADPAALNWSVTGGTLLSGDVLSGALIRSPGENVGNYTITQGTLDNSNYAVTYHSSDFTITPRALVVTADSGQGKIYGNADPLPFHWTLTGGTLLPGDSLAGSLGRTAGENAGTYTLTIGSLGNPNYTVSFISASFVITPRPITVTPDSGQNKVYGNADPALTYTTDLPLIGSDVLSGALSRNSGNNVGSYEITQGTLGNANYQIRFTTGIPFQITVRPITVAPSSGQSKVYGNADPTLAWTFLSGSLAYSDTLSGALIRDPGESVGSYDIHRGTLSASANYAMTFQENGAEFSVTVRPITVSAVPAGKIYGDSDPALTYAITSGTLVFSDGLTGMVVRDSGENAGSYVIRQGSVGASSNYRLTFVNGVFTISPRPITVAATSGFSKVYGNSDPVFTWSLTSGGLIGSDSLSGSLSRVSGESVGTYAITQGTLNNPNYAITFVPAAFSVTARPITVTPDSGQTKIYGNSDPVLTWKISSGSLVPGDTLGGALSRAAGNNVGTYAITQGSLNNTNYQISFTPNVLFSITARPITVAPVAGQSKVYGNTDPALTWTLTSGSLAYSDTLSGSLVRAAGNNVGTYAITQGTLAASSNYNMTFVNGSFSITPRPITVTPYTGQTKVYGESDPSSFTWRLTSGSLAYSDTLSGSLVRAAGSNVGSYAITQGTLAASSNYNLTFVNGSFSITPRPITVTPHTGQSKVYGESDPSLTWSLTSGSLVPGDSLTGALTRSTGELVGNDKYKIKQGTLTPSSNYNMTYSPNVYFSILPRPISITPDSGLTKVYGNGDPTLTWHLTSGNLVGSDTLFGALSRSAGESTGSYLIGQGTVTNGNYTITFVSGPTFSITPRPITVAPIAGQSRIYGNPDPVFAWSLSSGSLAFSDTLSGSMTRTAGENVGSYVITQGTLSASSNYTMTFVNGSFSIMPRPITVAPVAGQSRIYGDADPVFAWNLTSGSLVFSDTLSGGMTRAAGENVGSYAITPGSLSASSNYTMTFVNGSFSITPRPLVVTATSGQNKIYGNADPSLLWSVTSGTLVGSDALNGTLSRVSGENVGNYAITQGTLGNPNYGITFVSNPFHVTPRPLVVTATSGQNKIYGNADPSLLWSVTSGNLVGSDVLNGTLSRVSGENVGSYAITQGTLGNSNYGITFISNSFSITQRPIVVTANGGQYKVYGNSDPVLLWSVTSGNLVGSDTLSGSLSRVPGEDVGSYALLQGTLGNSNYGITFVSNPFHITPRSLVVTATAGQGKIYGNSDPSLLWTLTAGTLAGTDTLSGSLSRVSGENVGSYAITQGTLGNPNYGITFVSNPFHVTPRPLVVTATSGQNKIYGNADPSLLWSVTSGNLVGSDALNGTLSRVSGENVGSYAITQGTLGNPNYGITFVSNPFHVTPRPLVVTATSGQNKIYGNADPSLLWSVTSGNLVGSDALNGTLSRVSGENVGSYGITQGTLGNSNYGITFVSNDFSITSRSLEVRVNPGQGKIYGDSDPVLSWYISSGSLIGSDTLSGMPLRLAGEHAGTYAVGQGSLQADGNYSLSFVGSDFTITPRSITVTPLAGQSKIYGSPDPVLLYAVTSGNLIGSDVLSGLLNRSPGEDAGLYSIGIGSLANANYAVSFIPGVNFAIAQAPITVTADSGQGKIYGDVDPVLLYAVTSGSLIGSDTLNGNLTRASGETVGEYGILQGSLDHPNYAITYVGADFSITSRSITVTADSGQGKVYGSVDPVLTWQITSGTLISGDVLSGSLIRVSGEHAGTYAVQQGTLSGGGNYSLTYVGADFTITPRAVTVESIDSLGKIYGNSDPALLWQITSGTILPGDSYTGTLTRISGENVGSYEILPGTLSFGSDYAIHFVNHGFTITPRALTVSASSAQGKSYGDADGVLTYSISSGSLAFSDSLTGSLERVSGETVGSYTITQGTLSGGANYQLDFIGSSYSVTPRVLTVNISDGGKVYGDSDPALQWQITSGSLAFSDSFTGTVVRIAGEDAGTYAILPGTLALNANYNLTVQSAVFTISTRPVTVTGDSVSNVYGDADPALTWRISAGSLIGSDGFTGSMERDPGSDVGTYQIRQGSLSLSSNYHLTFVNGGLNILPRDIVISAEAKSKTITQTDPALSWTVSNLIPGDSPVPGSALTRVPGEAVGDYEIRIGTVSYGSNYNASYVPAYLTINEKATVNILLDAKSKIYHSTDPTGSLQVLTALPTGYTYTYSDVLNRQSGEDVGLYRISLPDFHIYDSGHNDVTSLFNLNVSSDYLTVMPATVTVTPDSGLGKDYDGTDRADLTYSVSGVFSGDVVSFHGSLVQNGIHIGTYEIGAGTLSSLNPNYTATVVPGVDYTISPRAVSIRADSVSRTYGDADPALSWTILSGSVISGDSFTGALLRTPGESVGDYPILQNTLTLSSDYQLFYTSGVVSITPRSATITVVPGQARSYDGTSDSTIQYVLGNTAFGDSGFVQGALLQDGVHVGSYDVRIGTLSSFNANYTLSLVPGGTYGITPREIIITTDSGQGKVYGDSDSVLTWTVSNVVSGDGPSGVLVRDPGENIGSYTIGLGTLTFGSDYHAVYQADSFVVAPRSITVAADNFVKTYGDADPALTYSITSGTLASGDSFGGALSREIGEQAGTYVINSGTLSAGSNYDLSFVPGILTVTPRSITVSADAGQGKIYGETDPALSWSVVGGSLLPGDVLSGTLSRTPGEDVGVYNILTGGLSNPNYAVSFVGGSTFTVSPRSITVTVDAGQEKIYGETDPGLTWRITIGNLVGSDVLLGALIRDAGENAGSYAIHQGTLENSNYQISFNNSEFTISQRAIVVTPDADQGKVYGESDSALSWTLTSGTILPGDSLSGFLVRDAGENAGFYAIRTGTLTAGSNYVLTVAPADYSISPRTVVVENLPAQGKTYGDSDPELAYRIASGSLAFVDSFTGSLSREHGENAGGYGVLQGTLSLGANYNLVFRSAGDFSITPRPITITPSEGQGKIYGNADGTLSWRVLTGSLIGSDTLSGSMIRASGENVGIYAIHQGTLENSNYAVSFVSGTGGYSISPRAITVSADDVRVLFGKPDPALTWQITLGSLVSGDSFTGSLVRQPGTLSGTYGILQGSLALNGNYSLTYVPGVFTIRPPDAGGLNYFQEYVNNEVFIRAEKMSLHVISLAKLTTPPERELRLEQETNASVRPRGGVDEMLFPDVSELGRLELPGAAYESLMDRKAGIFQNLFDKTMEKILNYP